MSALVYTGQHRRVRYAHTTSPRPPQGPLFWFTVASIISLCGVAYRLAQCVGTALR